MFVILCLVNFSVHAEFTIGISDQMSSQQNLKSIQSILDKIYAPLNIKPVLLAFPAGRGLLLLNQGKIDAEYSRIQSTAVNYPHLIKIPSPINVLNFYYFCLDKENCTFSPNTIFILGRGFLHGKEFCKLNSLNCTVVKMNDSILNALELQRGNAVIANMYSTSACKHSIKKIYRKLEPRLALPTYHYVHKKHSILVPQINQSIHNLTKNGEIKRIRNQLLKANWDCQIEIVDL